MPGSLWPLLIWGQGMTPAQLEVIKGLLPGLVQISPGLNSMHFERCCMEDKASRSASSSKDFYSLISTSSAIQAPLEMRLGGMLMPWGTSLVVNRLLVFAGSSHGSCCAPLLKGLKQSWLCSLWDPSFGLCTQGQYLPTWQLHCSKSGLCSQASYWSSAQSWEDSQSQQQIDVPLRKGGELRLLMPDSLLLWLLQGLSISFPTLTQLVENH